MKYPLMKNNISRQDLDSVIELLREDDPKLTNGPRVLEFEAAWSEWLGVRYSTFVSSGSAANFVTMQILRQMHPGGGEVIVPTLTWVSDIASVIHHGFKPVFVDIEMPTLSMDTGLILDAITDDTVAVFMTHAQGFNGLTRRLCETLKDKGIHLIEDVCESHGATFEGAKLGSLGYISNFSFFYAHHMSTIEGGMICTDDPDVYEWSRMLRSHGMVREAGDASLKARYSEEYPDLNPDFIFSAAAFNFRNNEIGATIGLSQLPRLDGNNFKRTENFEYLLEALDPEIFFTEFQVDGSSNYAHQIILNHSSTHLVDDLMGAMRYAGIEYRRGSAGGGNQVRQPYLSDHVEPDSYKRFPVTEHVHSYGFYIGNYPDMPREHLDDIVKVLNSVGR